MDDVWNDVIVACPFNTDPRIFGVWHKYFDATFFIAACIHMLTALMINVAHLYRRTRDRVGVRTVVYHDSSNFPHSTAECRIFLCNFIVGDLISGSLTMEALVPPKAYCPRLGSKPSTPHLLSRPYRWRGLRVTSR